MPIIRFPHPVPYTAQVASPELAQAIFTEGYPPAHDPRWAESGAASPEEYASWTDRACGIACVKMCVEALGGPVRPLHAWIREGVANGGYLIVTDAQGRREEKGWLHQALADLITQAGFSAQPRPASLADISACLRAGQLVIASVSYELGTDLPITRRSGHLVVLTGLEVAEAGLPDAAGLPIALFLHNPSGRRAELRVDARIPLERFQKAFSGRVIVVAKSPAIP